VGRLPRAAPDALVRLAPAPLSQFARSRPGGRLRTWGPPYFAHRIYSDVEHHNSPSWGGSPEPRRTPSSGLPPPPCHNSPEPTRGRLRTWGPPYFAQRSTLMSISTIRPRGAAPPSRAGRPRPACRRPLVTIRPRRPGVGCGPGVRPTSHRESTLMSSTTIRPRGAAPPSRAGRLVRLAPAPLSQFARARRTSAADPGSAPPRLTPPPCKLHDSGVRA